jgi:CCR4-NOT transcription complex subunit 9
VNTPSSAGLPINVPSHILSSSTGKLLLSSKHGSPTGAEHPKNSQSENEKIHYLIVDLLNPLTRELALLELSKKREQWDDLALVLWHSFGQSNFFNERTESMHLKESFLFSPLSSVLIIIKMDTSGQV